MVRYLLSICTERRPETDDCTQIPASLPPSPSSLKPSQVTSSSTQAGTPLCMPANPLPSRPTSLPPPRSPCPQEASSPATSCSHQASSSRLRLVSLCSCRLRSWESLLLRVSSLLFRERRRKATLRRRRRISEAGLHGRPSVPATFGCLRRVGTHVTYGRVVCNNG